jgi:DNA-binding transcriptional regulator GbsR (MarR family)
MPSQVSDARSNKEEQIVYAAEAIGQSKDRAAVFEAICFGKAKSKSVSEIVQRTGLSRKRVLEEARKLVNKQVVDQTTKNGETAYVKDAFLAAHRGQVLRLATNRKAREAVPTKRSRSRAKGDIVIKQTVPASWVRTRRVTIDDIDSFKRIQSVTAAGATQQISEQRFKKGLQAVVGDKGKFVDWGGEKSDVWTSRLRIGGRRWTAALALKGPGLKQKLTPARMGKNGDQIQRLFISSADVFLVQHWREIDESVVVQLQTFAEVKSLSTGNEILFGIIDGEDSARLITAYPKEFK